MITNLIQKEFEQAINQGNQTLIEKHMSQYGEGEISKLLNTRLPSGELPLHLAIRRNFPKITKLFLEKGANPLQRDIQRMQALDHASFSTNPLHKAHLLSAATGTNLEKIQQQMQCKAPGSETKLKKNITFYKTAGFSFFTPNLGKEVYQGNISNVNKTNINTRDSNGLTPIHYAILGNNPKVLYDLLSLGADTTVSGPNGDSLLHIAALRNTNPQIVQMLLYMGIQPNTTNTLGQTPLHYASIEDNLPAMQTLALAGAKTDMKDFQGVAPLALVGSFVSERDPLKISFDDVLRPLLFGTSILMPIAMQNGWISVDSANQTIQAMNFVNTYFPKAMLAYMGLQMLFPSPLQERTGIYSSGGLLDLGGFIAQVAFSSYLPSWLQTGLTVWNSYKILLHAQEGLQTCYLNAGYRSPLQIGMKGFLHLLSASPTLIQIQQLALYYFNTHSLGGISDSITEHAKDPSSKELKTKAGKNLFEYYTKLGRKPTDVQGKQVQEELWPLIKNDLKENNLDKLWRDWSRSAHPDKNKNNPDAQSISAAGGAIHDCLKLKLSGQNC